MSNLAVTVAFAACSGIVAYLAYRVDRLQSSVDDMRATLAMLTERIGWIQEHATQEKQGRRSA